MLHIALQATPTTALITDPTWIFSVVLSIILFAPLLLRQLRVPPIIGLILAGILVGKYGLNLLAYDSSFELFGQVGIYYIMFLAGLELEMGSVEQHGLTGLKFGFLTFCIPFTLGILTSIYLLGYSLLTSTLLACIYASHTLVTYPIVGRYGLNRHPVVVVSVVATALALFAALLVLAIVIGGMAPDTTWATWAWFAVRCGLYGIFVIMVFPRIGRWFLRRYEDSVMQYIFILALVFLSASLAKMVGLEGLLGAFLAGLVVNRLIPKTSPLMTRLEFVGNALFIPYFLIGVGMIIDLSILYRHPEALWIVAVMVLTGALTKLIASGIMAWSMGEGRSGMELMFGLTNAHAAGALAIVMIGTSPNVQLMDDEVLNGTVMLILFSCIVSGFATNKGAKKLALSDTTLEDNRGSYHGKCLITFSQEDNVDVMTQLAILIRNPFIPDSLMGLAVAYDGGNNDGVDRHRRGKILLEKAQMIAASADVPMATLNRMSTNIAGGILHTMNEYDCGEVIMCLTDRTTGMPKSSLGTIIDNVVNGSHREVMAVRNIVPPGTIRRVVVAVPQKAEYEVGFYKWLEHICRIGEELDCHLEFNAQADTIPYIRGYMESKHSHVRTKFNEMNRWMQFLNLRHDMGLNCMLVAVTARPGFISYQSSFEELPLLIHRYFSETNVMLLYPDQWGEPKEGISVFTPNGTAVQRQTRSISSWLRRRFFSIRRSAMVLLAACPLLCQAERARMDKLSPMVRQAVLEQETAHRFKAREKSTQRMLTLIQASDPKVLQEHGSLLYQHWGDIYAAAVPRSELAALSQRPEVTRIECGRTSDPQIDTTAIITRSANLRTPTASHPAYTGRGVVVGVMDIGFDLTNPTFWSRDMKNYRIKSFWDMMDYTDNGDYQDSLIVGTAYVQEESILRKAHSSDSHIQFHGSHTASTAAGSGYDSPFIGMAPDADICLVNNCVSSDLELVPDSLIAVYNSITDLLGFDYIFRYADSVGKPCVINFSEGSHEDLWGEAQLMSTVLDSLVRPGHIICAAAGNQSIYGTYMHKPVGQERAGSIILPSSNTTYMMLRTKGDFSVRLDFMASPTETHLSYEMPLSDILATEDSLFIDTITAGPLTYQLIYGTYPCCYDPDELVTDVVMTKIDGGSQLKVTVGFSVLGKEADIQVYQEMGFLTEKAGYDDYQDADSTHNIHWPGCDPSVICVGSTSYHSGFYNHQGEWISNEYGSGGRVTQYSSRGPTLTGLTKPDVVAPGTHLVAAYNSFYAEQNPTDYMEDYNVSNYIYQGRRYSWSCQQGTSMSCPVVAGIIAQWMEAVPTLSREQIVEAFEATSHHNDPLLSYPNCDYGHGEIDAEAGLQYLLHTYDGCISPDATQRGTAQLFDLYGRPVKQPVPGSIYITTDKDGRRKKMLMRPSPLTT